MARLEELTVGTRAEGIVPGTVVTIKSVSWTGNQAVEVIFEDASGRLDRKLVFRDDEHEIDIVSAGRPWSFEADGHLFRLVSEAHRIRLAWLFDPFVAITTHRSTRCHTRSARSTRTCCRASRSGSCSPMIPAPARP